MIIVYLMNICDHFIKCIHFDVQNSPAAKNAIFGLDLILEYKQCCCFLGGAKSVLLKLTFLESAG